MPVDWGSVIGDSKKKMIVIIEISFDADEMIRFLGVVETGLHRVPDKIV